MERGLNFTDVLASLPPDMDVELDRARKEMAGRAVFIDSPVSMERIANPLTEEAMANWWLFMQRVLSRTDLDGDEHKTHHWDS